MLSTPTKKSGRASTSRTIPSSPPVRPAGFVWTITVPAWAKASVTIAKAIPATRRLTAPNTSGTATATTASSASVAGRPHSHSVSAIAGT